MTSAITQFEHLKIPLEDVLKSTNNFAKKNIIGKGGFGNVYKGLLIHNGMSKKIAARRLDPKGGLGDVEFWTEISVLSDLHTNRVYMIGYCDEKGEKVIISQHYSKGSLLTYLSNPTMTWSNRWRIVSGLASAIKNIHGRKGKSYYVIHRNINSSTILLDDDWYPILSGFEFSIIQSIDRLNHIFHSEPIGTQGYMDPSIERDGGVTSKSDIYSMGVVIFEVICGRRAYENGKLLVTLVKDHYEKGTLKDIIHPDLVNLMDQESLKSFAELAEIAYSCLNEDQALRPSALSVISKLNRLLVGEEKQDQLEDHTNDVGKEEEEEDIIDFGATKMSFSTYCKVKKLEHLRIRLRDILLATNNFSKESTIKQYRKDFSLYKAKLTCFDREHVSLVKGKNKDDLPKRDYNVMIKLMRSKNHSIYREIESLSHCNHHNIDSLLGFCEKGSEMILVYEAVSTKYVSDYLRSHILTWEKRLKICIDVANGLHYLHGEIEDQTKVIHNNISCATIKLDDHCRAKISGFENSLLLPLNEDDVTIPFDKSGDIVGKEYKDQEYLLNRNPQTELDVYGFGVFMFEILCGDRAFFLICRRSDIMRDFAEMAREWINTGTIKKHIAPVLMEENNKNDFFLHKGPNKDSFNTFIKIAYRCLAEKRNQRPRMKVVIEELGKALAFHENGKDTFKMSLEDIKMATEDFNGANKIGEGGFGGVYKGKISHGQDNGHSTIVAKKLDTSHGQGEKQYHNELEILYVYKHENIISLVGYSNETDEKIIVYEYAARGSLDNHLRSVSLTWRNRLKICIDAATGLEFLHGGVDRQVVIHRDIKAANILLFDNWKAKLGDFGLSLISAIDKETDYVIDHPCGTKSYVDPLYLKSGLLTVESDIYSYGVVLFEILCGRPTYTIPIPKNISLPKFIKHNFEEGKQDAIVFKAIKEEIMPKSLTVFLNIIYKCLDDDREKRPTSKEVLAELKKALEFQVSYYNYTKTSFLYLKFISRR